MVTTNVVSWKGSSEQCKAVIARFVRMLTGDSSEKPELAKSVFTSLGFAALDDIKEDFLRKARGGTGEDGVTWPPLKPATIAARRFVRGEKTLAKAAFGLGKAHTKGIGGNKGLLTAAQQKRWYKVYSQSLAWLVTKHPIVVAKGIAAGIAWNTIKKEGAKTMLEVYGARPVEILRDTSILINSLSQGRMSSSGGKSSYTPSQDQVFQTLKNGVIVGTSVPYAGVHQTGSSRGVPARPFLPIGEAPDIWKQRWLKAGMDAVSESFRTFLAGAK